MNLTPYFSRVACASMDPCPIAADRVLRTPRATSTVHRRLPAVLVHVVGAPRLEIAGLGHSADPGIDDPDMLPDTMSQHPGGSYSTEKGPNSL